MEGVKSRSESPFARNKGKSHLLTMSENGNRIIEQVKTKKKNQRNKNKQQLNGKEIEDIGSNGQNSCEEEEKATSNETDNIVDSNNTDHENETGSANSIENGRRHEEKLELDDNKETDVSTTVCEASKEVIVVQTDDKLNEDGITEQAKIPEENINVDENSSEESSNSTEIETESSAKNDKLVLHDLIPECEVANEISAEKHNQASSDVQGETNGPTQQEDLTKDCLTVQEASQIDANGSDDSLHYEEANLTLDDAQVSPDTVTKDESFIPSKITNFMGKFGYSPEQKQDSEISSSKKIDKCLNHPYLSKVSGRRGIKDRLNSSATVFGSENGAKTPENVGVSLDDSFRVHTNPPRLNPGDLDENPTLRKFKGKRCLNAGDEPEEGEDPYLSTMKRRKLDERAQESGILGSILWSPFKKRSLESENQLKLTSTESKLSRLLSPFWFWKKATDGQKRK